jgi:hypothetical protein
MDRGLALQCLVHTKLITSRHSSHVTRNFLSRAAGLISAGPRAGPSSERARAYTNRNTRHINSKSNTSTRNYFQFHNPRIVDRGPQSPFDTSPRRAARASAHASLASTPAAACMQILLPPAAACCIPRAPAPTRCAHSSTVLHCGCDHLWTPSTTLPRPSAGCALDDATMDGSAPKASPPAAKATPKPSASCYEATELAIRLA